MDYKICIPTYNRPELIDYKTLPLLYSYGIPADKIYLFVSGQEQYNLYKELLPSSRYKELICKDAYGIGNIKNEISKHFAEGERLVIIEDDISKFVSLKDNKLIQTPDLHELILQGFKECEKNNTILWGIFPVVSTRYMLQSTTANLKFIVGSLYGFINDPSIILKTNVKEDYELTLEVYRKYKAVVRLNFVSCYRGQYPDKSRGGLHNLDERIERTEVAVDYLLLEFPEYVKEKGRHITGLREIRLHDYKK